MVSLGHVFFFLTGIIAGAWIMRKDLKRIEANYKQAENNYKQADANYRNALIVIQHLTALLIRKKDV